MEQDFLLVVSGEFLEINSAKTIAINIDEGEPGTFKDRYYLESDPHRFFEGMLIASKVVGIDKIYIYLRDEYPAVKTIMEQEIEKIKRSLITSQI